MSEREGPRSRRAAVLGMPVAHSLSPVLHRAAYDALGLSGWTYDALECDEAALPAFLADLGPEWVGLSLTQPLKRLGLRVADRVSPLARAVGAANTLLVTDGSLRAENTDVAGVAGALRAAGVTQVSSAVVLGAGATAQAALAALAGLGLRTPVVMVRDAARTVLLEAAAARLDVRPDVMAGLGTVDVPRAEVLVSALPPGAADVIRLDATNRPTVLLDVVYARWPTALAESADHLGSRVVGGHTMLLHQAVAQVELMTGRPAPVDAMRSVLARAVGPAR